MIKHIFTATLLGAAFLSTGCASIVSDSRWPVSINSTPDHAGFTVRNQSGVTVAGGTTPHTVMLPSGAGYFDGETYTVKFTKGDYAGRDVTIDSSVNGWYWGNLVFGGIIGFLIVDPATGAMWKLPPTTYADLAPSNTAAK